MNREMEITNNNNLLMDVVRMAFKDVDKKDRERLMKEGFPENFEKHYSLPEQHKKSFEWLLYTLGVDNAQKVTVNYILTKEGQTFKWYYDNKEIKPQCNNIVLTGLNSQIWQLLVLCSINDSNLLELGGLQ